MKEYTRILYNRGLHRSFGNSGLGSFAVFLTFLFLLRAAVNLYFVFEFSSGGADLNLQQISSGWFMQIAVYIILCSSLSAFHLSFAIPQSSFLDFSSSGNNFKKHFLRRAALLRPANIFILALLACGFFVFGSVSSSPLIILRGGILVAVSVLISTAVFKIARFIYPGKLEIQLLETGILFLLVIINPDIFQKNGLLVLLYYGLLINFDNIKTLLIIFISAFCGHTVLLLLLKIMSVINRKLKTGISISPMSAWYVRYLKINFWIFLYILIFPILLAPVFDVSVKIRAIVVYIVFCLFAFLIFLNHCENSLAERWQLSLIRGKGRLLLIKPVAVHLLLTLLPCVVLFLNNNGSH